MRQQKGQLDKALADFNDAIRLDPQNPAAYEQRAEVWKVHHEDDKAIADYSEAIRVDPRDAAAYFGRGVAWQAKGRIDRAIADYDRAIRIDPKNPASYVNRGGDVGGRGSDRQGHRRLRCRHAARAPAPRSTRIAASPGC